MTLEDLQKKYGGERVLCIPTEALEPFAQGSDPILYDTDQVLLCLKEYGSFQFRWQVEQDSSWKQVIPYVVMETAERIMAAKRLKGDPRLVGGYTVGMGGHINPEDGEDPIETCIRRELEEETTFSWKQDLDGYQIHPVSFVNVRNEVSLMHICIPVRLQVLDHERIQIRETEKLQGVWMSKTELDILDGKLEGWSEIALDLIK
ncbi:MAG: NUDIX domain-containing protein [Firmicutes bacterium]|nr:NUDIX domain-containing protein [Bacillota bacterium]